MGPVRKMNNTEQMLLEYLVREASLKLPEGWNENLFVQGMDDGGMGSFLIFQDASDLGLKRIFGKQVSDYQFVDDDGITVLVSLYLDKQNKLFEVDIWKTDYNPVITLKVPAK